MVTEARKRVPLNFSQCWRKKQRKQDKHATARAYKEFTEKRKAQSEKLKAAGKTEDQRVHFTGTDFELWGPDKVKES